MALSASNDPKDQSSGAKIAADGVVDDLSESDLTMGPVDVASRDQAAPVALPVPTTRTGSRTFSESRTIFSRTTLPISR